MTFWLVAAAFVSGATIANAVRVRRYSRHHVVGQIALGGRGLFFSRTPDGTWWRLQLRRRRCSTTFPSDWATPLRMAGCVSRDGRPGSAH